MNLAELSSSGLVRRDQPTAPLTTYKFGGAAAWYAEVASREELDLVLTARMETDPGLPLFVLGRGSNVVIADAGFPGLVIKLVGAFNDVSIHEGVVTAGAGVSLPRLARFCAAARRGGLEFYVGIPGTVGGAIVMNAGGHGSDTAEWLLDAQILDTEAGVVTTGDAADLDLSYRHSRIGPNEVVLGARFRTIARDPGEGDEIMREITSWRRRHQPGGTFNAGSVFKNPAEDAAGRIIDAAGLKGFACGGASVSERHANFFVAAPGTTARDVYDLVHEVRRKVLQLTGIALEPEIRFIGDFEERNG